ncbi:MAG: hypothetical protein KC776_36600, partial [Myxococcales bacterium]|nr:hypothetical protein [Myxococcales bacterium]
GGAAGAAGSAGTGGVPVTCAGDTTCVAPAPSGWTGPVTLRQADACAAPFAVAAFTGGDTPVGAPPTCDCACDPTPVHCTATLRATGEVCVGAANCGTKDLANGQCTILGGWLDSCIAPGAEVTVSASSSCAAIAVKATAAPEPTWNKAYTACAAQNAPTCAGGGTCLPTTATLCIATNGDQDCPGAPYVNKTLVFTTINDTRGCQKGSCSCGTPSCAGQVNLYGANSCSGGGSTVGVPSSCAAVQGLTGASTAEYTQTVSCTKSGAPMLTGELGPTDPKTVCCM